MLSLFAPKTETDPAMGTPANPIISNQQNLPIQNDPVAQVEAAIHRSGGDAKAAFYSMAQEKGIDPNQFLNRLQSIGDMKSMAQQMMASDPRVKRLMSLFSLMK